MQSNTLLSGKWFDCTAIEISANIPHVKALADIGLDTSIDFCQSVGLPKFENEGLSLALGGLSKGVTVTEMAGAYSAIANDGTFVEPTFYKYVTNKEEKVVIEPKQTINNVMSKQNAYVEKSILTEPVVGENGTAKYCAIDGMSVAAKTGTTNDDYDRWLCGFTPYYTAVCWYGYETNAAVVYNGNPAGKIWEEVMKKIHSNLDNAEFVKPDGIVEESICKITGLKATKGCYSTYTEVFSSSNLPENCNGHKMSMICSETGLLASEGCPFAVYRSYTSKPSSYCPHGSGDTAETSAPAATPTTPSVAPESPPQSTTPSTDTVPADSTPVDTTPADTTPTDTTPIDTVPSTP